MTTPRENLNESEGSGESPRSFEEMFLGIITTAVENAVEPRFAALEERLAETIDNKLGPRLDKIEGRLDGMDERFDALEKELASLSLDMNKRFDEVDKRFDEVDKRFDETHESLADQITKQGQAINQRFDNPST